MLAVDEAEPVRRPPDDWAEFDSVQGLGSIDRDIRVAGVNVGEIGEVVRDGDDARVELVIDDDVASTPTPASSCARTRCSRARAFVDLHPGSPSAPVIDEGDDDRPRADTRVYVSLDEALRVLREPVREACASSSRSAPRRSAARRSRASSAPCAARRS